MASSDFGRMLSVGAICFEDRFCASKKGGIGGGGWVPVCANKATNGPATADQGSSLASQDSCHVHGTPG